MERKFVSHTDFLEIGRKNDVFLWHFLQKNQSVGIDGMGLALWSIFDKEERNGVTNHLRLFLDEIQIPYYESYVEDSIDFLAGHGIPYRKLWRPDVRLNEYVPKEYYFNPVILGFKKFKKISSTFDFCYCIEGLTEVTLKLDPQLFM